MAKANPKNIKRWTGQPRGAWITVRKIIQYTALVGFLLLFIGMKQTRLSPSIANLAMRLDPLAMLANSLANRTFLAGSTLALLTVLLTILFGRAWCGWLCPLGTVLDLFPLKRLRTGFHKRKALASSEKNTHPVSNRWRAVKYTLLIAILVAALLGNLSLLIFDPLTIFLRSVASSIWPALDQLVTMIERGLYQIPFLSGAVSTFDGWVRPLLLPTIPVFYQYAFTLAVIFTGIILLNALAPRFWCRYLCPLGGLLGIISKAALVRRKPGEDCLGCTVCTSVCPTGTIDPDQGYTSDPSECTMCLDCLEACPRSAVEISPRFSIAAWNEYDPNRRQALTVMGGTILAVALFHSEWLHKRLPPHHLRPPGTQEESLLAACVRCGACVRSCPTGALQPAATEAGLEGIWTPLVVPRQGYCDYSCNACGQVCPVSAIPALSLDEKRQQVIGKAYIDQNRCIAWADKTDCIVCEEMCPLPEKAITLVEAEVANVDGAIVTVKQPQVNRELCIGCGICEYKCPLSGEAAIRVFTQGFEQA